MRAHLRVELRAADGRVVTEREADNAVLQSGADLLARLFSGQGAGITHMAVGSNGSQEGEGFATPSLTGGLEVPIPADAFQIDPPDPVKRVVRVRVRGTVPAAEVVPDGVREAALVSRTGDAVRLYNRVVFAPIEKTADHELTLFWEVGFPFGDLQWLL